MSHISRRAAALTVDLLLSLGLTVILADTSGRWLSHRAVTALAIDQPTSPWHGPLPLVLGAVGSISYGLPLAFVLLTVSEVPFGQSPGKALVGLRLTQPGWRERAHRLLLRDAPWYLALAALLVAEPAFSVASALLAVGWAVAALATPFLRRHLLQDLAGGAPRRLEAGLGVDQRT